MVVRHSFGETLEEERRHGFVFPLPMEPLHGERSLARQAAIGLNRLAGSKYNSVSQHLHRPATAVQQLAFDNIDRVIGEAGECPEHLNGRGALLDMMKSHPTYGEPSTLAPFVHEKLKILQSLGRPKNLRDLVPPQVMPLLQRRSTHIEMTPAEVDKRLKDDPSACPPRPYWDPVLKNSKAVRTKLLVDLWKVGVVSFRTSIKASVGLFFVKKKTPEYIRMVVDCRISNIHHRSPPVTRLGSGSGFIDFDLSPEMLGQHFEEQCDEIGWGSEMDVSDCFYQFSMPEMSKWFGIDDPRQCKEWRQNGVNLESVFDEDLNQEVPVNPDTILYPVIGVMPMGWSWALWFANETVAAIANGSTIHPPSEIREKMRVPQLWETSTVTSTYVDNVAVFGAKRSDVETRIRQLSDAFAKHDIPVVWTYPEPTRCVETVGVILDFERKVVRNKPMRLWKIFKAGQELCRRSKVRAESVEVWLGHATSAMRLAPFLLSCFSVIYRFVRIYRGSRVKLWPAVRAEIMQASSLIWFSRAELGGHYIRAVDMGDSSNAGYAMTSRSVEPRLIHDAMSIKERWRFVPLPEDFKQAVLFFNKDEDINDEEDREKHTGAFVRSGVGMDTEYGRFLQQALKEGSWLRTSPILSQFRARKSKREDVEVPQLVKPISSDILVEGSFRTLWMRKWRNQEESINLKEARVCLSSLKRAGRVASQVGARKLTLCDNLSAVLAFEKGRSSSMAINRVCKTAAAIQAATQIRWRVRHVETKRNQADGPSRGIMNRNPWMKFEKPQVVGDDLFTGNSVSSTFHIGSSQTSYRACGEHERKALFLQFLVPPPGLDISGNHCQCTCPPTVASERKVHSATDDHGHAKTNGTQKKKRGRKLLGCWELFCGDGNLTKALRKAGLRCIDGFDILRSKDFDATLSHVPRAIFKIVRSGHIGYLHMGTPCTVFSRARRNITNLRKARKKEIVGCELAFLSAELAIFCHNNDIFWSIENPRTSRLWEFPAILGIMSLQGVLCVDFPMCAYKQNFKKPTRILTNNPALLELRRECVHHRHPEVLKGRVFHPIKGWINRTCLAGSYPPDLCRQWAQYVIKASLLSLDAQKEPETSCAWTSLESIGSSIHFEKSKSRSIVECPITSKIPGPLDEIVFGQHSVAEAERRRRKRHQKKDQSHQKERYHSKVSGQDS